ncbi:hypothetical protein Patl1_16879 [Pistacia atlantica]|uniref:Uncharacterized protein n=1 Tax=Pistacia atlantica TaxID=434234 RepID=A0ACC1BB80_9ROSI|nr:hypothetical protein Patl1_16879 [Pistacia atlantica]
MALGRRSKSLKQRAKRRKKVGTSIESLPKDVMATVLALVASKSLTDLINAKLSCKYLLQTSDDDFIFEKASIDKFSIFPWWNMTKQVSKFLNRCEESGNPEWLYILGGEQKQHGLKLLASLKRFRTREFRTKIRENFRWMWTRNMITINIEAEDFNSRSCDCLKNWNGERWEGEDAAAPSPLYKGGLSAFVLLMAGIFQFQNTTPGQRRIRELLPLMNPTSHDGVDI